MSTRWRLPCVLLLLVLFFVAANSLSNERDVGTWDKVKHRLSNIFGSHTNSLKDETIDVYRDANDRAARKVDRLSDEYESTWETIRHNIAQIYEQEFRDADAEAERILEIYLRRVGKDVPEEEHGHLTRHIASSFRGAMSKAKNDIMSIEHRAEDGLRGTRRKAADVYHRATHSAANELGSLVGDAVDYGKHKIEQAAEVPSYASRIIHKAGDFITRGHDYGGHDDRERERERDSYGYRGRERDEDRESHGLRAGIGAAKKMAQGVSDAASDLQGYVMNTIRQAEDETVSWASKLFSDKSRKEPPSPETLRGEISKIFKKHSDTLGKHLSSNEVYCVPKSSFLQRCKDGICDMAESAQDKFSGLRNMIRRPKITAQDVYQTFLSETQSELGKLKEKAGEQWDKSQDRVMGIFDEASDRASRRIARLKARGDRLTDEERRELELAETYRKAVEQAKRQAKKLKEKPGRAWQDTKDTFAQLYNDAVSDVESERGLLGRTWFRVRDAFSGLFEGNGEDKDKEQEAKDTKEDQEKMLTEKDKLDVHRIYFDAMKEAQDNVNKMEWRSGMDWDDTKQRIVDIFEGAQAKAEYRLRRLRKLSSKANIDEYLSQQLQLAESYRDHLNQARIDAEEMRPHSGDTWDKTKQRVTNVYTDAINKAEKNEGVMKGMWRTVANKFTGVWEAVKYSIGNDVVANYHRALEDGQRGALQLKMDDLTQTWDEHKRLIRQQYNEAFDHAQYILRNLLTKRDHDGNLESKDQEQLRLGFMYRNAIDRANKQVDHLSEDDNNRGINDLRNKIHDIFEHAVNHAEVWADDRESHTSRRWDAFKERVVDSLESATAKLGLHRNTEL